MCGQREEQRQRRSETSRDGTEFTGGLREEFEPLSIFLRFRVRVLARGAWEPLRAWWCLRDHALLGIELRVSRISGSWIFL